MKDKQGRRLEGLGPVLRCSGMALRLPSGASRQASEAASGPHTNCSGRAAAPTRLLADAKLEQAAADGHALGVELVQEAARVPLHAQPPQPVGAHGLAVVARPRLIGGAQGIGGRLQNRGRTVSRRADEQQRGQAVVGGHGTGRSLGGGWPPTQRRSSGALTSLCGEREQLHDACSAQPQGEKRAAELLACRAACVPGIRLETAAAAQGCVQSRR